MNGWLTEKEIEKITCRWENITLQEEDADQVVPVARADQEAPGPEQCEGWFVDCLAQDDEEIILQRAKVEGFSENVMELLKGLLINVRNNQNEVPPNLRYMKSEKFKAATVKINNIITIISTKIITETNMLLLATANSVANMVGYKNGKVDHFHKFVRFLEFTKFGYYYINGHNFIQFEDTLQFNVSNSTISFRN